MGDRRSTRDAAPRAAESHSARDNASRTCGRDCRRDDLWLALVPRDLRPGITPAVASSYLVRDACPHHAGLRQTDRGAERLGGEYPPTTGRDNSPGGRVRSWPAPRPAAGRPRHGRFPARWRVRRFAGVKRRQPDVSTRQSARKSPPRRCFYLITAGPITVSHSDLVSDSG